MGYDSIQVMIDDDYDYEDEDEDENDVMKMIRCDKNDKM